MAEAKIVATLPTYLSFFLSMESGGQRQIEKLQYGQTKPGLNLNKIKTFKVPNPPREQQKIFEDFVHTYNLALKKQLQTSGLEHDFFFSLL